MRKLHGDPEDFSIICGEAFLTPAPCRHCADLRYVPIRVETATGRRTLFVCRNIMICKEVNNESDLG